MPQSCAEHGQIASGLVGVVLGGSSPSASTFGVFYSCSFRNGTRTLSSVSSASAIGTNECFVPNSRF